MSTQAVIGNGGEQASYALYRFYSNFFFKKRSLSTCFALRFAL